MLTFNKESFCLWLLFVLFVCNRLLINQKLKKILQRDKKRSTQSVILNFIFLYYNITRQIRQNTIHRNPGQLLLPLLSNISSLVAIRYNQILLTIVVVQKCHDYFIYFSSKTK